VFAILLLAIPEPAMGDSSKTPGPRDPIHSDGYAMESVSPILRPDGSFVGAPGVVGAVDAGAWSLASDLERGEAPRLVAVPASTTVAVGTWSGLGSNGHDNGAFQPGETTIAIDAIVVSGKNLYVGGMFTDAAGIRAADNVARWDGKQWKALGSDGHGDGAIYGSVSAIAVSKSNVYIGGYLGVSGVAAADNVAEWDGSRWKALGSNGHGDGAISQGQVMAVAVFGSSVYVAGYFENAAGIPAADNLAVWNGTAWSAVGSDGHGDGALGGADLTRQVYAIAFIGSTLYVGGRFTDAGGDPTADYVAAWDGHAWSGVGSNGSGDGALNDVVVALGVHRGALIAGGAFKNAAQESAADFIARWDGVAWSPIGDNNLGNGALNGLVYSIDVHNGAIFAAGQFTNVAGIPRADYVARWDGGHWSAIGSPTSGNGALNADTFVVAAARGSVYAGGRFTNAAGQATADHLARWTPPAYQPDVRIRAGTHWDSPDLGDDVYGGNGVNETVSSIVKPGNEITFQLSVENDGARSDSYNLKAQKSCAAGYAVTLTHGTTNIAPALLSGTLHTATVTTYGTYQFTATVHVDATAATGSSCTWTISATSAGAPGKKDVARFMVKRG
jgi:hypothetical protein